MMRKFAVLMLWPALTGAQSISAPDVPEAIKAPAGEVVILRVHAKGVQIYTCGPGPANNARWILKAPDALLHGENGAVVGRHFEGPAWKLKDGSEVRGKAVARVESPDSGSVPWLLVHVTGHTGKGVLEHVTSIQRVHTAGGQAPSPAGCDSAKYGAEARSPYTADYIFFAPAK
jgi:hypothetical protein